jgi:hypothetical protein
MTLSITKGTIGTQSINITGGSTNPVAFLATQTYIRANISAANDGATVYTVTAGKTLYITCISASTSVTGNLLIKVDGTTKISQAGVGAATTNQLVIGNGAATILTAGAGLAITTTGGGVGGNWCQLVGYEV